MKKNQIVIEKYVILKSFVIYLVIRFISALWIYLIGKYKFFTNVKMGNFLSVSYLLLPILLSLLIPIYFWKKQQKRLAKWLMFFLVALLLFGADAYVGLGIPFLFAAYDIYKTNVKKQPTSSNRSG